MIEKFIEEEWDIGEVYSISDVARRFMIDIRLARYHLMKAVDNGRLCQLKYQKSTYYLKREWKEPFERFLVIGVRLL